MSSETANAAHLTSQPTAAPGAAPQAPAAARVPSERTHHGDTFVDEFAWLADKENPETIAYLEAQNAYTEALTADQSQFSATIFDELKARTKETDLSVPVRKGGWWYYTRTVEGQQYGVQCRRAVQPGEAGPPITADGGPLDGEEVLLDSNEVAGDSQFFALGTSDVSPDGSLLAYSTDFEGSERFTVRVKNLVTGEVAADEIPGAFYGSAWSADGSALFYVTVDEAWRPHRVWRHLIGTLAASDVVVFEEADERFWVGVGLARSERYLFISSASKLTSEAWLLDAANPTGDFSVVVPRRHGVEYSVEHQLTPDGTDRLLILHNDHAENFELAQAPVTDPSAWTPLIGHRADTRLLGVDAFAAHLVVHLRRDGLTGLRVLRAGSEYEIDFPEPVYLVAPGANPEYASAILRLGYASLVTPDSVYDCDIATGELTLLRRRPVLPLPGGPEYDPADYEQRREWATAADGTQIPMSLVWRRGTPRDGSAPVLLYGYGSYEISIDPSFSIARLSLLDRGFVYAIAHVRGGGEMGRHWYDDGKMRRKINTFADFVACARHMVEAGWTKPERIVARGGSAGGLLMGAAVNIAPEAFGGIVAQVPFVDALTSMLDPALPLTVTEWEEWGDPLHDAEVYRYMKSYSPYENIDTEAVYPPILAVTSLNDTRVLYSEPAKWIAKLQALAGGGPFLLKTEMTAGHGGRSGRYDAWREEAMVLAWAARTAGISG
jgi:oligopeptidase B